MPLATHRPACHLSVAYTPCAPLAALGLSLRQIDVLKPIRDQVHIVQKMRVHTPIDKLLDALITILVSPAPPRRCASLSASAATAR
jgi:hypothetical protein